VAFARHEWDFFKPDWSVEYPVVDGKGSEGCYYRALDDCYERWVKKLEKIGVVRVDSEAVGAGMDYWVFHAPYNKLVQKSFARFCLLDARRKKKEKSGVLDKWLEKDLEDTYRDKLLEKELKNMSKKDFDEKLGDANWASKEVGNTYTASVFLGLCSLVDRVGGRGELKEGKSIGVFSYGSGSLASMYRIVVRTPTTHTKFTIPSIAKALKLTTRLENRRQINAVELDHALAIRARMHHANSVPYEPLYPISTLAPGTFYLKEINSCWHRIYERTPLEEMATSQSADLAPACALHALSLSKLSSGPSLPVLVQVTGLSVALPGNPAEPVSFSPSRLLKGETCLTAVPSASQSSILEKNIVKIQKSGPSSGSQRQVERIPLVKYSQVMNLVARLGPLLLTQRYGLEQKWMDSMDKASQVAVAVGLEALKDAGLLPGTAPEKSQWELGEEHRERTGVIFASSFPGMDSVVEEVTKHCVSNTDKTTLKRLLEHCRRRDPSWNAEDDSAATRILSSPPHEFDRKFLFRILVHGNAQLAQLVKARGPNIQCNAACSSTTQSIALAQDALRFGRADRMVVVAGDVASGETLLPWVGGGFCALGATCNETEVERAGLAFDKRRSGMLLGAGGVGMVLETRDSATKRKCAKGNVCVVATHYSNSGFHGSALDRHDIQHRLTIFLQKVEKDHGITKDDICSQGIYVSHETGTHASPETSCAFNEIEAVRGAFGEDLFRKMLIVNTKAFTGHPMGVSFEDATAIQGLIEQRVPPIANYKERDENLGDLNLSRGGPYCFKYALRFAAGFGSQIAFVLYSKLDSHRGED